MSSGFNCESKQKKSFKVKFSGNPNTNSLAKSRDMILGSRHRMQKDYSMRTHQSGTNRDVNSREVDEGKSVDSDTDASKRELHSQSTPFRVSESSTINCSSITDSFDVISSFFQYEVNFKLIFRASKHNFSIKDFHETCDAYEDTLVLCLTEDNKVVGGYTPLTWEDQFKTSSTHFKTDFSRETFLFSVSEKIKYPLLRSLKNKAICCCNSYGPAFGGGYDLLIGDRCNELPNATSYFPRNFEHPNLSNFNKRDFTGTSRKDFKLLQWEVFHVIKVHSLKTIENINLGQPRDEIAQKKEKSIWNSAKAVIKNIIAAICSDS